MRRLISTTATCPPGSWRYKETFERNGRTLTKTFYSSPEFSDVCKRVRGFRLGNKLPRPSMQEVAIDVEKYMLAQPGIGDNPRFSYEANPDDTAPAIPASGGGCAGCGAVVTP